MAKEEVQTEAAEAAAETTGKEAIYEKIAEHVKAKTDKRIGKTGGREIFDLVVSEIFAAATAADGSFRFNGGFGSLHVREYQAGERRLPNGDTTTFGERKKLRYEEGVVVKALVENGGDLTEALKVRGSRAKPEGEAATDKPKADKPKADKVKPAETKAADPAPEAEAPAGEVEGDLDLD